MRCGVANDVASVPLRGAQARHWRKYLLDEFNDDASLDKHFTLYYENFCC